MTVRDLKQKADINSKLKNHRLIEQDIQNSIEYKEIDNRLDENESSTAQWIKLNTVTICQRSFFCKLSKFDNLKKLKCAICNNSANEVENCKCTPVILWND